LTIHTTYVERNAELFGKGGSIFDKFAKNDAALKGGVEGVMRDEIDCVLEEMVDVDLGDIEAHVGSRSKLSYHGSGVMARVNTDSLWARVSGKLT
jgi:hypothetical protein